MRNCLNCGEQTKNKKFCSCACSNKYHAQDPGFCSKISSGQLGRESWSNGLTKEIDPRVVKISECVSNARRLKKWSSWNKGLTKESDERLASAARKNSLKQRGKKRGPLSEEHKNNISLSSIGSKNPNWRHDREAMFEEAKIKNTWRHLLKRTIAHVKMKKTCSTEDLLGYTAEDLKRHVELLFEEGMTWSNHGIRDGCWHVDHVRPVCSFPVDTHPSVVNALENLRPLWESDNLSKGRKYG